MGFGLFCLVNVRYKKYTIKIPMEDDTYFIDKTGKKIYIGDTLQFRLGKFAKKGGGATMHKVIRFGKRAQVVDINDLTHKYGERDLTNEIAKNSVIVDRSVIR